MALVFPAQLGPRKQTYFGSNTTTISERVDQSFKLGLPPDFPRKLKSPMAWSGSQFSGNEYVYHLEPEELLEIGTALAKFKTLGIDGDLVNSQNFYLPKLSVQLKALSVELHNGKGFFLLRGLPYHKYSLEDNMIIFLGIQSFIAEKRARQDELGNMIVHVIADSTTLSPFARGGHIRHSTANMSFHTDNMGDVLAFQTRSTACRGGNAILSSAYTVYNELAATRPDLIAVLAEPNWPVVCPTYHERPLLFHHESRIIFSFFDGALPGSKAHPQTAQLPSLSNAQLEALHAIQKLADKHQLSIQLQAGDMHFVNNLAILHSRDTFEIAEGRKRHLVRMWLRSGQHAWKLPRVMREECGWDDAFGEVEDGNSDANTSAFGGVEREDVYHLEPMPHVFYALRTFGN